MMRVSLMLIVVLALNTVLATTHVSDLVERVKREVITESLGSGSSPARRKSKVTPFSRMMTVRNAVVRRAFEELSQVKRQNRQICDIPVCLLFL